jgi:hypothetical protein
MFRAKALRLETGRNIIAHSQPRPRPSSLIYIQRFFARKDWD